MDPIVDTLPTASFRQSIAKHPVAAFLLIRYPRSWVLIALTRGRLCDSNNAVPAGPTLVTHRVQA